MSNWKKISERRYESGAVYESEVGDYIEQNLDAIDRLPGSAMTSSYRYVVNSYEATVTTKDMDFITETFEVDGVISTPAKALKAAKEWCESQTCERYKK